MRLKQIPKRGEQNNGRSGNRGGFSFEIETLSKWHADKHAGRGNRGGFSFEIETMYSHVAGSGIKKWQPGRLLV